MRKIKVCAVVFFILFLCPFISYSENLGLQTCIQLALKNNGLVQSSEQDVKSAKYRVSLSKSAQGFKATLSSSGTKTKRQLQDFWSFPNTITVPPLSASVDVLGVSVPISFPATTITLPTPSAPTLFGDMSYSLSFRVTKPLYTSGRLELTTDIARLSEQIAKFQLEQTQEEIISKVITSYYQVLRLKRLLDIAKETEKIADETLKAANEKLKLGKISELEVMGLKLDAEKATLDVQSAENAYKLAAQGLLLLLGKNAQDSLELQEDKTLEDRGKMDKEGSVILALSNRSDVKLLELSKQTALLNIKLAKRNNKPNLGSSFSYDRTGVEYPPKITTYSFSVGLEYPLFDSGETSSKIGDAEISFQKLLLQENNLKSQIEFDVKEKILKYEQAFNNAQYLQKRMKFLGENQEVVQMRYKMGQVGTLEVSQQNLLFAKAKLDYVQALYDTKVSYYELQKSLGSLGRFFY